MADSDTGKSKEQALENKDVYKIALDTRNFEISLFWQRSNYFLVLNSALALGFFNLQKEKQEFALLLAVFGLLASFLWYRVNLGSKYWQSRWEQRLSVFEKQVAPDLKFFAADWETIQKDVQESLANSHGDKGCFRNLIDKAILKKPSVTVKMILLSLLFFVAWTFLIVIRVWKG